MKEDLENLSLHYCDLLVSDKGSDQLPKGRIYRLPPRTGERIYRMPPRTREIILRRNYGLLEHTREREGVLVFMFAIPLNKTICSFF